MKYALKLFFAFSFFSAIVGCDELEVTSRDYPRINTLTVTEITTEGVRFNAEVIFRGDFEVITHGFVWSQDINPSIASSDKVAYSENIQSDKFSSYIPTEFHTRTLYFVRAFIETEDFLVYGENIIFSLAD